jgi:hypothetical protein
MGSPEVKEVPEEVPAPDWVQQLLTEGNINPIRFFP